MSSLHGSSVAIDGLGGDENGGLVKITSAFPSSSDAESRIILWHSNHLFDVYAKYTPCVVSIVFNSSHTVDCDMIVALVMERVADSLVHRSYVL